LGPGVTLQGNAQNREDDSALFIGLRSDDPSQAIEKFVITVTNATSDRASFLINQVDFSSDFSPNPPLSAVPAPLSLFGLGAGLAFSRRMKTRLRASRRT
jgi:hypothetical protein